jgi:quinol monooxygenase YgiN
MITFVNHMRVPPENASAFEELLTHVAEMSNDREPGVVFYGYGRSVDDPDTYAVVEVYQNQAACASHGDTDWVKESVPKFMTLIEGATRLAQYVSAGTEPIGGLFDDMT